MLHVCVCDVLPCWRVINDDDYYYLLLSVSIALNMRQRSTKYKSFWVLFFVTIF